MRFNRILLVQARYDSVFSSVLPAGIGCLSEALTSRGIDNDVFDLNISRNDEKALSRKVEGFRPDLIGFSMMSLNYRYNYGVMERIRRKLPGIKIATGGAHVSTMRDVVLTECSAIDFGVTLEGEHTLVELIEGVEPHSIRGLIWRDGGRVVYNGDRQFIKDLDSLPYPKYGKFDKRDYSSLVSIFSSRGCPFECTYCPVQLAIGKRFVARSPKSVVDELEYHYRQGRREFSFRDDNFTLVKERVYEICDEIEKRGLRDLYLMCDNGVRADRIDLDMLRRMKDVGFRMIGLGVESGEDRILKGLKKSATVNDMERAIRAACELGYIVELYFLIGSPGETWPDFEKTVALATRFPVLIASFYHLLPYPGTELYELADREGYLLRRPEEYLNDGSQRRNTPFMATPEFPEDLRRKAFDYAYRKTSAHIRRCRREYSRKGVQGRIRAMGAPEGVAAVAASLYASPLLYDNIFASRAMTDIKRFIRKRTVSSKAAR